jgi:hypothetical protein
MVYFKEFEYCGKLAAYKCSNPNEIVCFITKKEASEYKKTLPRGLYIERIGNVFGLYWGFMSIHQGFLLKKNKKITDNIR